VCFRPSRAAIGEGCNHKRRTAVRDDIQFHRISETDSTWIDVDLNRRNFILLGIKLDIWKGGAGNQQRVAFVCEGLVPSRPIPPVVYGPLSGTTALPKSALIMGGAEPLGNGDCLVPSVECALTY
jgi:hypothetical protein